MEVPSALTLLYRGVAGEERGIMGGTHLFSENIF
jgi:hypothetical protein